MRKVMLIGLICAALGVGIVSAATVPYSALGVVQQTDPAARTVTLAHQPVQRLNWPAMTMQFSVAEPALFERLPAGQQVAFEFVRQQNGWRIVNAIPIAQSTTGSSSAAPHGSMHGGMMGDMASMHQMCMNMMGQTGERKR